MFQRMKYSSKHQTHLRASTLDLHLQGYVTEARSCREEEKAAERKGMKEGERRGGSEVRGVKENWGEGEKGRGWGGAGGDHWHRECERKKGCETREDGVRTGD